MPPRVLESFGKKFLIAFPTGFYFLSRPYGVEQLSNAAFSFVLITFYRIDITHILVQREILE